MHTNTDMIQRFTVEEFQNDFDNLMKRVEEGESFFISSEYGEAVITPYDELVQIHTDHDEGC